MQAPACNQRWKNHRVTEVGGECRHRGVIHTWLEVQSFRNAQHVIDDVSMFDTDALGAARGATRINHIGEVFRTDACIATLGSIRAVPIERIQGNGLRGAGRQTCQEAALREQQCHIGICEHECDSLLRIRGINRHVSRSSL